MSAPDKFDATGQQSGKAEQIVGPEIIGEGERLCFTPCHHAPIRLTDGRLPPVPAEQIYCPRGGEPWILTFPAVKAGEDAVAVWRRP